MTRRTLGLMLTMITAAAAQDAFLGKWDITAANGWIYWLEVKQEGGRITGSFLNRGGSVTPLPEIAIEGGQLTFAPVHGQGPKVVHRAKVEGGKLLGVRTAGDGSTLNWTGVRPPRWPANLNSSANLKFGPPVELFDGKSIEATWNTQDPAKPSGWKVENGVMTNDPHANNLVSKQKFSDFKIRCEYKLEKDSNSGIYLRGRYELQVLDDFGKPAVPTGHMGIYSRVAPATNASKPVGEWQTMEATIVGNRVTVFLNGKKVHDNQAIDGITGGALDADEAAPGPIMLQGDHEKVFYRKVTVWPVAK